MIQAFTEFDCPVGPLLIAGDDDHISGLWFMGGERALTPRPNWRRDRKPFQKVIEQLQDYFTGGLQQFELSLAPEGTPFQLQVWRELERIPYGETISYKQLAQRIGNPNACRAVGLANGANPISIIVPCHRVIGANGKLTGYGGGLTIKEKLLSLERRQLALI